MARPIDREEQGDISKVWVPLPGARGDSQADSHREGLQLAALPEIICFMSPVL